MLTGLYNATFGAPATVPEPETPKPDDFDPEQDDDVLVKIPSDSSEDFQEVDGFTDLKEKPKAPKPVSEKTYFFRKRY